MDKEEKEEKRKKTYRSATMTVVANGFVIEIGCQMVIAETPEKLKELICDYLDDPYSAEKKLMANSIQQGGGNCGEIPLSALNRETARASEGCEQASRPTARA